MFKALQHDASVPAACASLAALARAHFALQADDEVVVSEHEGTLPGWPPLQTVIAFWTDQPDGSVQAYQCRIFKPVQEVGADDLPPPWMKPALVVVAGYACDCC